jgi:crotonobetainyl-CoA:carnitine CoA-transferase CaiB-like acyl-CoA transferase
MAERGVYSRQNGVLQAAPAPRFSATPSAVGSVPQRGEHTAQILRKAGLSDAQVERLITT